MIGVALWVANLPGAVGRIAAFGVGPLMLGTAGLLLLCLLRTPLRLVGLALGMIAAGLALTTPRPDVLIASDGRSVAVRGADGRLSLTRTSNDTFAVREWLAADADPRTRNDKSIGAAIHCDDDGCIGRLTDGRLVALSRTLASFAEDCRRATVIASPREAPPDCTAPIVIDRSRWRDSGAVALYLHGRGIELDATRPPGYDRPWAPADRPSVAAANRLRASDRAPDATPRSQDLQPED
jgi:competence protein ComEC